MQEIINLVRIIGIVDFDHRPEFQISRRHNVSKTGSVSTFRCGKGDTCSVGSFRKSYLNPWATFYFIGLLIMQIIVSCCKCGNYQQSCAILQICYQILNLMTFKNNFMFLSYDTKLYE
jgi:hypothetical protein